MKASLITLAFFIALAVFGHALTIASTRCGAKLTREASNLLSALAIAVFVTAVVGTYAVLVAP